MSAKPYLSATLNRLISNRMGFYLIIGIAAACIDLGLFVLLHDVTGIGSQTSHALSVSASAIFSFTINAWFNFKETDLLLFRFVSFVLVVLAGYLLGALIISAAESLGLQGSLGKLLSLPPVALFQYYLNAKISFRSRKMSHE